ncbi:MAG: hypothetical protein ACXVZP_07840 [Gaiellaceae bacterium]
MCCESWARWCFSSAGAREEDPPNGNGGELRQLALRDAERRRRLKFHLGAFALGLIVLGGSWVGIEYMNQGWPERLSGQGHPGDWDPTILLVLIVWALLLAIHALGAYFRRPLTTGEVDRALGRVRREGA